MIKLSRENVSSVHRPTTARLRRVVSADSALLDQLLATLPCGVGILDSQFRFVRVSSALCDMDGIAAQAHVGKTVDQVLGESRWRSIRPYCSAASEGHTTDNVDVSLVFGASGRPGRLTASFFPIHGCGAAAAVGIAVRDRTIALQSDTERTAMAAAVEEARDQRRRYLAEMLLALTGGKLRLCREPSQLPPRLDPVAAPVPLSGQMLCAFRHQVLDAATELQFETDRAGDFVMAVGEALDNVIVHAGIGSAQVLSDTDRGMLQVWVADCGPGIAEKDLHRAALERGFTTAGSFGHGFYMMLNTCDRIRLHTSPAGTTVVLEQDRFSTCPAWLA